MFAPCTESIWYSSSIGQKLLTKVLNFWCFLRNKQVSLFLNSLLLSLSQTLFSSTLAEDHLHTPWGHPGTAQMFCCSRFTLWTLCLFLGLLQTCGTPQGASCSETECGGPNCRTDEGQKKCGGPGCGGLVTVAHSAWQKTMDFDQDVLSALAEVEQLSRMVIPWMASVFIVGLLLVLDYRIWKEEIDSKCWLK